jgi:hypothetical protein
MTTESSPPLVGFNNNVRYRGMRFHIQTEDSGVTRPHIITHLFADGGHVIKSVRTDYSEYLGRPDRPSVIHKMMREQHRAMALDLRDGRLDATIDGLSRSAAPPSQAEPDALQPEATQRSPGVLHLGAAAAPLCSGFPLPEASAAPPARTATPQASPVVLPAPIAVVAPIAITAPAAVAAPRGLEPSSPARTHGNAPSSKTLPAPSGVPERTRSSRRSPKQPQSARAPEPPPSAPATENSRSSSRRRSPASSRRPAPAPDPANRKHRPSAVPSSKRPPASSRKGRPAPALPANPSGDSIFGTLPKESLDDAILSYVSSTKGPSTRRPK